VTKKLNRDSRRGQSARKRHDSSNGLLPVRAEWKTGPSTRTWDELWNRIFFDIDEASQRTASTKSR